jgi:hypothetical protein
MGKSVIFSTCLPDFDREKKELLPVWVKSTATNAYLNRQEFLFLLVKIWQT